MPAIKLDIVMLSAFALLIAAALATIVVTSLLLSRLSAKSRTAGRPMGEQLVGRIVRVAIPIPQRGVGSVACYGDGKRSSLPARCAEGGALPQGTEAVIVEAEGPIVGVRALFDPQP